VGHSVCSFGVIRVVGSHKRLQS